MIIEKRWKLVFPYSRLAYQGYIVVYYFILLPQFNLYTFGVLRYFMHPDLPEDKS